MVLSENNYNLGKFFQEGGGGGSFFIKNKLKSEILNDKKLYKQKRFSVITNNFN